VTAPETQPGSQYAVLRCIRFDAGVGGARSQTSQVRVGSGVRLRVRVRVRVSGFRRARLS